jgi:predicted permease
MRFFSWFTRRRIELDEEDFREEIRAHLALAAAERIADGEDPEEARYAALREFGNVARTAEAARRVWMPRPLETLRDLTRDVRYAVRALARHPGFALTVVAVLAVGIGLNATVFTLLKGMIFSPLSGVHGSAAIAVVVPETSGGRPVRMSYPDYRSLREHDRAFAGLLGTTVARVNLGRGRAAHQVWGELVTGNYFDVLGVRAQLGRTLLPSDEEAPGKHPVVVISDSLWRRAFGSDPQVLGQRMEVNGRALTIVGVAASRFYGTTVVYDVSVFVPIMMAPDLGFRFGSRETTPSRVLADPAANLFFPQGFLRAGIDRREAAAQVQALWSTERRGLEPTRALDRITVVPFSQMPSGAPTYIRPTLTLLTAMGLLILLIVCANIAGLVLVRGLSRRGEIAVRLALGAAHARIVRLLVIENLVLAAPGALLGVVLANLLVPTFVAYAEQLATPDRLFFNVEIDGVVIAFSAVLACACAFVFGYVPAVQSARVDLVTAINEDASPRSARRHRLRTTLVVAQVAVSMLLLVGAGLVTRSLEAARRADPGFDPRHVATLGVDLQQNAYDRKAGRVFYRKLLDTARADATVESATLAAHTPMGMQDTRLYRTMIEGYHPPRGEDLAFMSNAVGPDYFRTLRVPILAGREFEDADDETGAPVAIVNRTLAERFWGGAAAAIGSRLQLEDGQWRTVVAVAADLKYARVNESPRPYIYVPFFQAYRSSMILHARSRTATASKTDEVVARMRRHVTALDADLPIMYAKPMTEQIRGAFIFFNLAAAMVFIFGTAGLGLAALGTYGLVSYAVRQSTHEIGVRLTLGASRRDVLQQFVRRGLKLGVIGAALGTIAAFGAGRLLGSVLYGVSAFDGISFMRALGVVVAAVLIASLVPAWHATRTSPLSALRHH